jgi:hypothetical protein
LIIENGIYRHYKGMLYRVNKIVRHSETLEELVYYEALYENKLGAFWVRPLSMFLEDVVVDGKVIKRFQYTDKLS